MCVGEEEAGVGTGGVEAVAGEYERYCCGAV